MVDRIEKSIDAHWHPEEPWAQALLAEVEKRGDPVAIEAVAVALHRFTKEPKTLAMIQRRRWNADQTLWAVLAFMDGWISARSMVGIGASLTREDGRPAVQP